MVSKSASLISILMACRIGGNDNSNLKRCLASLVKNADDISHIKILVKFDSDDESLSLLQKVVSEFENTVSITSIVTPRAGGYGDLHKAYLDLLRLADPKTTMYWVLSDDITIDNKGWDNELLRCSKLYEDGIFVLHTSHLLEHEKITPRESIESPDGYPVWSARWIAIQGGFGYTFATDGWTSALCHRLKTGYNYDRRTLAKVDIARYPCAADMPGSERWHGIRKQTHDFIMSPQLQILLDATAQNFINTQSLFKRLQSYAFQKRAKTG